MNPSSFNRLIRLYRLAEKHLPPSLFSIFDMLRLRYFDKNGTYSEKTITKIHFQEERPNHWVFNGIAAKGFAKDGKYLLEIFDGIGSKYIEIECFDSILRCSLNVLSGCRLKVYVTYRVHNPVYDRRVFMGTIKPTCPLKGYAIDETGACKISTELQINVANIPTQFILFVTHQWGGGATKYLHNKIIEKQRGGFGVLVLSETSGSYVIKLYAQDSKEMLICDVAPQIVTFLKQFEITEIIINEMIGFHNLLEIMDMLRNVKESKTSRIEFLLHDYYAICPSFLLLNQSGQYCIPCKDTSRCNNCFNNNPHQQIIFSTIDKWRKTWADFFEICDAITAFSDASYKIFEKVYDCSKKIQIVPHSVQIIRNVIPAPIDSEIHIAVLGDLMLQKGSEIIRDMCEIIQKRKYNMKIIHYGTTYCTPISYLIEKGPYKVEQVPELFEGDSINLVFIPSIWPETYSFTTEEAISTGVPVAVFDLGAPAERVKRIPNGLIIPKVSPTSAVKFIHNYFDKSV